MMIPTETIQALQKELDDLRQSFKESQEKLRLAEKGLVKIVEVSEHCSNHDVLRIAKETLSKISSMEDK